MYKIMEKTTGVDVDLRKRVTSIFNLGLNPKSSICSTRADNSWRLGALNSGERSRIGRQTVRCI